MNEGHEPASRRNGRTGPKTTAGKRRSAGNARKHGLAAKKAEVDAAMGVSARLAGALAAALPLRNAVEDLCQSFGERSRPPNLAEFCDLLFCRVDFARLTLRLFSLRTVATQAPERVMPELKVARCPKYKALSR
jgi:hypothetical protein